MNTRIAPRRPDGNVITWERQYLDYLLVANRLRSGALQELVRCADRAFDALSPSAASPDFIAGAIVGAVQSGKTGLMIKLAARALDRGYRVVVVLAGLKDDLRTQTALRFTRDLLQRGDAITGAPGLCTHPNGPGFHGQRKDCWAPRFDEDVHDDEAFVHQFCSNLRRGNTVLAVAKKNVAALNRLREAYEYASSQFGARALPMLVLDDECDEASVSGDSEAPTPERIAQLWDGLPQHVAYIGLTATPAANLLQDTLSVLYPRNFVLCMRTPGDRDSALTYLEPDPSQRYTGGYAFYENLEAHQRQNFLVRSEMSDQEFHGAPDADEELEEALIAYFVAGAIRARMQPNTFFNDPERLPAPHTMLVHTESRVESHWALCERVVRVTRRKGGTSAEVKRFLRRVPPQSRIAAQDLEQWLQVEGGRWRAWYERYRTSRDELLQITPDLTASPYPSWENVQSILPDVFRAVKLKVVNSDESSVDAPLQFQPTFSPTGIRPPDDIYSIIIGGNRLSRGLTIEGLCTSYYTRSSLQLLEDTTIQRERWFGYRGGYLEFCRLLTHRSLAIRLRRFHEHDEDLRRQLAWNIEHGRRPTDATYRFLTIRDSLPTAKLGRGSGPEEIDLSGARPFVDRVQMGMESDDLDVAAANEAHTAALAKRIVRDGEPLATLRGDEVGCVLRDQAPQDVESILDGFCYTFHNPEPSRGVGWNLREFYRAPKSDVPATWPGLPPRSDPLLIAAYLRYWRAAFEQCVRDPSSNCYRADDSVSQWQPCPAPRFNIAVRFGSLAPSASSPFTIKLLDRAVDPDGVVGSRWGGRGYGSAGDEWIDMAPPSGDAEAPRPRGALGLLLLHVIGRDARGRDKTGCTYSFERPCLGLVIPAGGPCIRYVLAEDTQ